MRAKGKIILPAGLVLILIGAALFRAIRLPALQKPLASAALGDGRILQVEGVTYGINHHIGNPASEVGWRLNSWLPSRWRANVASGNPESVISGLESPALVVWVNAISSQAGTNVDCQGVRVKLVDEHGQHFAAENSSWFGGNKFWRVGYRFQVYPRSQAKLILQVTAWKEHKTNQVEFPNPHVVQPAVWTATDLPQQKQPGDLSILLSRLQLRTNAASPSSWETRSVYWEPVWELRRENEPVGGWGEPEWLAEDPTGNRGKMLGTNQPVLRYSATFYPAVTNVAAAAPLAHLPQINVTNLSTILWWNQTVLSQSNHISILGYFPAGSYVFYEGAMLTNPPVKMGPVAHAAPSGWTGQRVAVNPLKVESYHGHYSFTNGIIYVSAPMLNEKARLGIRLRDDRGRSSLAIPEPGGAVDGIYPFLVTILPGTNWFNPELVLLRPVEAEFTVKLPDHGFQ